VIQGAFYPVFGGRELAADWRYTTERDNFAVGDRDIAAEGGDAGAIDDSTVLNQEIIRHRLFLLVMRRWGVGQRARGGEGQAPSL